MSERGRRGAEFGRRSALLGLAAGLGLPLACGRSPRAQGRGAASMQSGDPQTPQGPSDPNQHLGTGPQGLPPSPAERPPVLFIGHGSPMNAIEDNQWSRGLRTLAGALPRPRAILAISAHWYVDGTLLTVDAAPRTIHDFGGFPRALYEIRYPAPGAPDLAARVRRLVAAAADAPPGAWGLDHGTWSVLRWLYPDADVPVVQLSLDRRLSPAAHHELGRALADLRDDGVMILGSGNITHNLRDAITRMQSGDHQTPAWARRFDLEVRVGAGAYVCGEETALLESLEGKRGMVRFKPPLPAIEGLFGKPTVINNVITLASVPIIMDKGAEFYRDFGMGRSRGTLPFQLAGNIRHGGLVEKAFGVTVRELLYDYGGGTLTGRPIRAVQIGGPLGAYLPESQFDTPL
ncbi:MAG TPA: 4,5-DOPA dioxygenase extradiol, partial [Nannocystaceae bacterium]|nr:4,5-DOPA dioxygenase extradiol [Nannocystaceae bacterium]